MILLDTNVISEPLKRSADPRVLAWIDAQALDTLYLSSISLAELRLCIEALPGGRRKASLQGNFERHILSLFAGRILAFDASVTPVYAQLRVQAKAKGLAISMADGCIAAIAKHHGLMVATRDTAPFEAAGLKVINPWDASA